MKKFKWELTCREYAKLPDAATLPSGTILSVAFGEWSFDWLSQLELRLLQGICEVHGISYSGARDVLINRLLQYREMRLILEPHAIDTIIDAFKLDDLKAMCRKLKLGVSPGVKRALGARLLNWLNDCKKKGTSNIVQAKHALCVKKAILAGKPVPQDVREEYPQFKDLQQKDVQIRFSLEF